MSGPAQAGAPSTAPPGPVMRWVIGARPRTLPAAIVPVVVASALSWWAWRQADPLLRRCVPSQCHPVVAGHPPVWWRAAAALVVALAVQIGTNFANDYSDGVRGTDRARVGPLRLVASGVASATAVRRAAVVSYGFAAVAGVALAAATTWWLLAIGASCLAAGWLYTGGPAPYGYAGLGEVFVFLFFGVVATVATVYVVVGSFPAAGLVTSVALGLLAAALLEANNLRDIAGDRGAGKRTLAVVLGRRRAGWLYLATLAAPAPAVASVAAAWNPWVLLALAAAPLAFRPARLALSGADGARLVPLLAGSARLQVAAGGLLAVGFVAGGIGR